MDIRITPARLSGRVKAPPSKSAAHRAVLCAALAQGESHIRGIALSEDIHATIRAARALGAHVDMKEATGTACIHGIGGKPPEREAVEIDCGESGSTLRFFIPVAAALGCKATFTGRGQLPNRPVEPLAREMARHGAVFSRMDGLPLTVEGRLTPGGYGMPGNISSQYITGLLFALALNGGGTLTLTSPLESAGYVDMTIQALNKAGVTVQRTQDGFSIPGGQKLRAFDLLVEGDYSNAAFWLCAAALGCNISCLGLSPDSAQGDKAILDLLLAMGARRITVDSDTAVQTPGGLLHGREIDVSAFPDLFPVLAVTAAAAHGETKLYNAGRLRIKECDRLAAMAQCLHMLDVPVEESKDSLTVQGKGELCNTPFAGGVTVDGHNDHRIVMAMSVAALLCKEPIIITGAQAVGKSYPDFFDRYRELGGKCDVL